jgi:hypothetical protein
LTLLGTGPNEFKFAKTEEVHIGVKPTAGNHSDGYVFNGVIGGFSISCRSTDPSLVDKPWYILEQISKTDIHGVWLMDQNPPLPAFNVYDYKFGSP